MCWENMNRHCMTINNKNFAIERSDPLKLAKRYNIKGTDSIIEKAICIVSNYEHYAGQIGESFLTIERYVSAPMPTN